MVHTRKVGGSSPLTATNLTHGYNLIKCTRSRGQEVKTPPFHGGIRGSIPLGITKKSEWAFFVAEAESAAILSINENELAKDKTMGQY